MTNPLRVLEIGEGVAAAYAARLLADQGADVIKVETPAGDPARQRGPFADQVDPNRSGLFMGLNLNKRGVVIDETTETGQRAIERLLDWATIVVHSFGPRDAAARGLDATTLRNERPDLIVLAVTPFGQTGPYAELQASELTIAHAGGWAALCPITRREDHYPPLKVHGHHSSLMAGVAAATAVLATVRDQRRSGTGDFIDFSVVEYVASVLEFGIHVYTYHGVVVRRTNPRSLIPWRVFDTQDGEIFLLCVEQDQWERLVDFMGRPEWATLDVFATTPDRHENQDVLHTFLEEFIAGWKTFDLYHAAQKHRVCFAPVFTSAQLAVDPHLEAREFFIAVDGDDTRYPAPAQLINEARPRYHRSAPRHGEHSDLLDSLPSSPRPEPASTPARPLEGVRIVDMTWVWAGPFGSMNLAHLGAEVIRVESSVRPDLYRRGNAAPEGIEPSLNTAGMFNQWNQGKRSVAVDLRTPEGVAIVKDLIREADVVFQNFATGVLERMGLGYEVMQTINPKVILASISGYGQTGPYRTYMGYGPATGPLAGLAAATGFAGEGPEETGVAMPDPTAGITAAYAVTGALLRRAESGRGEHLDVTLWESTAALTFEAWMQYELRGEQAQRIGNRDPSMAPHGCFRTAGDDTWVTIVCRSDAEWQTLREVIGGLDDPRFDDLAGRKAHEEELDRLITAWTSKRDRWFVTGELQGRGIAAFPTFTTQDVVEDPHFNERGFIERLPHPEVGRRAHTGVPWRMTVRPNGVQKAAPAIGADTDDVLANVLGRDPTEIESLRERGVLQ